ncbi:AraC family transcriptional regulator [Pedobacter aquatilis]|uniref:helix-turn-helix domain-containing protein n=1 Tax=Pedobacter aquatilis TaxID=351343 RepID=UPI00292EA876|nr:AraC family transcriptional regulator [Pedobacter aquatilis]
MKILKQFEPLTIEYEADLSESCSHHSHNHFEIVYINSGSGFHLYNETKLKYETGDLFLISPGDSHFFEIEQITTFTYIKFNEAYFDSKRHLAPDEYYTGTPEAIMKLRALKEVKIEIDEPNATILKNIVNSISAYDAVKNVAHSQVVFYLLLTIFGIIKEAMHAKEISMMNDDPNNEQILSYIHENIYNREKVTVKAIASHFNISLKYFSNYFKRNFNVAYQEYLDNYRIKLVEKRISVGGLKLKQIAQEFGFSDVSHLSKVFRKLNGLSPSEFKNNQNNG